MMLDDLDREVEALADRERLRDRRYPRIPNPSRDYATARVADDLDTDLQATERLVYALATAWAKASRSLDDPALTLARRAALTGQASTLAECVALAVSAHNRGPVPLPAELGAFLREFKASGLEVTTW